MISEPEKLLRSTKGRLEERPLPLLFHALFATRRTAGLELKKQAFEKTIVFEAGSPVGCTSNLVHETLGRFLVEKGLFTEEQHLQLLATAAQREVSLEKLLADEKLVDPALLQRHLQANLAQRILDAFRWTDASYRIVGDVEIAPDAPRMNAPQILFTALGSVVPAETVAAHFAHPASARFALTHEPPVRLDELKLSSRDSALVEELGARPTIVQLGRLEGMDEDAARRRLWALSLLGLVDLAERVPAVPPAPTGVAAQAPAAPVEERPDPLLAQLEAAPRGRRRAGLVAGGVVVAAVAVGLGLASRPSAPPASSTPEAVPPEQVAAPPKRAVPQGPPQPRFAPRWSPAPVGAVALPPRPRELSLSASGIPLVPPPAVGPAMQHLVLGARHLRTGKPAYAAIAYQAATKAAPKSPAGFYGGALAAYLRGEDATARELLTKALTLAPAHPESHLLLGFLEQQAARIPSAIDHYRAYLAVRGAGAAADDVRTLIERLSGPG